MRCKCPSFVRCRLHNLLTLEKHTRTPEHWENLITLWRIAKYHVPTQYHTVQDMLNDSPTTGSAWTLRSTGVFYINTTVAAALGTSDRSECVGLFGALSSWYTLNSSIAVVRELLLWQSRRENNFTGLSDFHSLPQCHCVQYEYYIHFNHHCTL